MTATEDEILQIKRTPEFDRLRNNRLLIGAFRYGLSGGFDCVASAIKRLLLYQETGNKEHLVDAANLCELEFIQENHHKAHFAPHDEGEHCKSLKRGESDV